MGHDLFFFKRINLAEEEADKLLAVEKADPSDDHFISVSLLTTISEEIERLGIRYQSYIGKTGDRHLGVDYTNYCLSMYNNNHIALEIPYHNRNNSKAIVEELSSIIKVLLDKGLKCFDPQVGKALSNPKDYYSAFLICLIEAERVLKNALNQ